MTEPRFLFDVSILLALLDEHHEMHEAVFDWYATVSSRAWATCPLVENGFARIISQDAYPNVNLSVPMAIEHLATLFSNADGHKHWPDDVQVTNVEVFAFPKKFGHRRLTDAYLLALAVKRDGVLATLDTRMSLEAVVGASPAHLFVIK